MSQLRVRRATREIAKQHLETLGRVGGVQSAVLFSADGFEIASHATDATVAGRLAAVGSSLAALGSAISREAGLDDFERTTIESRTGTVTIMRIDSEPPMSVAVVANRTAVLGQLLWATRQCCQALARLMNE